MKLKKTTRGLQGLAVSLAIGLGLTACSRDYISGYLYVTAATRTTTGKISAYGIDYQTGALKQLADSPINSGGSNPIAVVAAPNGKFIYVVNHDSSQVVEFSIGTDGKLYPQAPTIDVVKGDNGIVGSFPTAAAIDPAGKFLYVIFTFQDGFTPLRPGPGGVAVYPIKADNSIGAPLVNTTVGTTPANPLPYIPVGNNPTGVAVSRVGNLVYIIDQERPATGPANGVLLAFSQDPASGALTPVVGPVSNGFKVGTAPSAIAVDPGGRFIYVTDQATNQLYGFSVATGGVPEPFVAGPSTTGLFPLGLTVDPRGKFLYVANFGSRTVSAYAIDTATGVPSSAGGETSVATGPTCVTIEPALGIYLYTSNNVDNSVSGEQLDSHTGTLKQIQGTQFSAQELPTCAVAVANGAHATQIVQ